MYINKLINHLYIYYFFKKITKLPSYIFISINIYKYETFILHELINLKLIIRICITNLICILFTLYNMLDR